MQPHYTPASCNSAYQLRWVLSVFPTIDLAIDPDWIESINAALAHDQIRILEYSTSKIGAWQLLLSTQPSVTPSTIV